MKTLLMAILFLSSFLVFAKEPLEFVPEKVMDLPRGTKPQEFFYVGTGDDIGYTLPCMPRFAVDGTFHILDPGRKADKIYDAQFNFLRNQEFDFTKNDRWPNLTFAYTKRIDTFEKYTIMYLGFGVAFLTNGNVFYGYINFDNDSTSSNLSVVKGITLYWTNNNQLKAILTPKPEEASGKIAPHIYSESEIRSEMLKTGSPFYGMTLDENGVLYVNGKPFVQNPYAFRRYHLSINPDFRTSPNHIYNRLAGSNFLKEEQDGTTYWGNTGGFFTICNPDGYTIYAMVPKTTPDYNWDSPVLAPNGDVYVIANDRNSSALYRIKKQW